MKLRNRLTHMFGGKVSVGGTIYCLDINGVVDNVSKEHSEILLQNDAWLTVVERKPIRTPIKGPKEVEMDLSKLKKEDLIKLLEYKNIDFDKDMKKSELRSLLEGK